MAAEKITAMTALAGADVADTDLFPVVDVSVADAAKNKSITAAEARVALVTAARIATALGYTPATAAQGAAADAALPATDLSAALAALGIPLLINTDGDLGRTIFVGSVDPAVDHSPVDGDVWLQQ